MNRNIILCIGSVTSRHYQQVRRGRLRRGAESQIMNLGTDASLHYDEVRSCCGNLRHSIRAYNGAIDGEVLQKYFLDLYDDLGAEVFTKKFLQGGWLQWLPGVQPTQVAAIVLGLESSFEGIGDPDGDLYGAIELCILTTWPNINKRPKVWRVSPRTGHLI